MQLLIAEYLTGAVSGLALLFYSGKYRKIMLRKAKKRYNKTPNNGKNGTRFGAKRDDAQKFKVELYIIIVTFLYRKLQLYHLCMVR